MHVNTDAAAIDLVCQQVDKAHSSKSLCDIKSNTVEPTMAVAGLPRIRAEKPKKAPQC
jgi:hypothetical protein